ncbi:oxidoreductase [Aureimonas ureilytica]|uniref:nitric oxide dioxygenase n=1 Tax=Aureimonas ureilytica TaxID=401562 RepID=A0A175RLU0_9HYPH|nr:2Fe-2S iron-sulfur cluster-binding protein [Aureimonas ureilytica]KTR04288.1 oxidoreductase [Aureimonas ureilytica]
MSEAAPSGFRRLRLIDIRPESEAIASFRFEPVDPGDWAPYRPGQFLVFRVPDASAPGGWALRNYSISGPSDGRTYRVSVKREPYAGGEHGAGLGSGHFHHRLQPGDEVLASAPRGEFVLDEASLRAVLLLSGGVGLTPLVAMLHRLAETSERPVFFIHAAENGRHHALTDEVEALAARRPGIRTAFIYRTPDETDTSQARHVASGLVTREVLQSLLPLDDYDAYLCGPPGFMRAQYDALTSLGLRPERIAYEFFGPASLLGAPEVVVAPATVPEPAPAPSGEGPLVSFAVSGTSAAWSESSGSLLDLAEGAGLSPPFSCRAGVCMSCSTRILSGEVEYFEDPLDEPPPGEVLLCCTRPRGSVTLDI